MRTTKLLSAVALAATAAGLAVPAAPALAAPVAARTSAAATRVPATLHWHDHGPSVARVQRILGLKATGSFDLHTLRAVQAFQRAHHIRATGNVGPLTWAALLKVEKQHPAVSPQARALAAAKAKADATLSDLADELDSVGAEVDADSGVLTRPESAVLNGRLDRVDAHGQALSDALDKARAVGWVTEINARAGHYIDVTDAIESQDGAAGILHPDAVVATFNALLDQIVAADAKTNHPVDPAKESAARAAVLSALRDWMTAAAPYARQSFATDPFGAGAPARIMSLEARAGNLPQVAALEAALDSYGKVFGASFDPTLPGLRADSRSTRSHTATSLPKLPWLH